MCQATTSLSTFFEQVYRPLKLHHCRSNIIERYHTTIRRFGEAIGHEPTLQDLNESAVSQLADMLNASGRGRRHLPAHRDRIAELWQYTHTLGLAVECDCETLVVSTQPVVAFPAALEAGVLADLLPGYFARNPCIRSEHTCNQYRFAVNNLSAALDHNATVEDLTDDSLSQMISHLQVCGLAPKTINERVGRIRALWRWLANRGSIQTRPTIGNIPEPKRLPLAWSPQQIALLFEACDAWKIDYQGISGSHWWRSLHYVAWDTGERISALLACQGDWITDNWLAIPAEARKGKTSDGVYKLGADTLESLASIREPKRELIWPWPLAPATLWDHYRKLRKSAGLPTDRRSAFHRIRRSVATHMEAAGGNATEFLGHSSHQLTKSSYLDPRFLKETHAVDFLFRPTQD